MSIVVSLTDIAPKVLTQKLYEPENDHLVSRKVYHEVSPKVNLTLTAVGEELIPFINHLRQSGDRQKEKRSD